MAVMRFSANSAIAGHKVNCVIWFWDQDPVHSFC
jgi:hypothetical protein